jgi:hypothetical protein
MGGPAEALDAQAEFCELRLVVVTAETLTCHQTAASTWVCCSRDGAPVCVRGLTLDGAVANWERAQQLLE